MKSVLAKYLGSNFSKSPFDTWCPRVTRKTILLQLLAKLSISKLKKSWSKVDVDLEKRKLLLLLLLLLLPCWLLLLLLSSLGRGRSVVFGYLI